MASMKAATKVAKPLMSKDYSQARRRAIGLYRAAYRYLPYIVKYFDITKSEDQCRWKLREQFYKNACIVDIRIIDLLVLQGYMELKEITHNWQQKGHIMTYWNPSVEPKSNTFLCKFLRGPD